MVDIYGLTWLELTVHDRDHLVHSRHRRLTHMHADSVGDTVMSLSEIKEEEEKEKDKTVGWETRVDNDAWDELVLLLS